MSQVSLTIPIIRDLSSKIQNFFQKAYNPSDELNKFKLDLGMISSSQNIKNLVSPKRASSGWNRKNQLMMGRFG